ncbi:MAG: GH116 family glycosyl hydrolase [Bacteroidota bacterium]
MSKQTIGYLVHSEKNLSAEEAAGWSFVSALKDRKARKITFDSIRRRPKTLSEFDLLWWHFDSNPTIPDIALDPLLRLSLKHYLQRGGSMLLSLLAAQYVVDLNFEQQRPNLISKGLWDQTSWAEDYPDIRGFASFQGHPVFDGLSGGFYTWNPTVGRPYSAALYNQALPKNGKIVGIERLYIKLNEQWRIINEYEVGKGKILTIGTYFFFAEEKTRFRKHLERFGRNCFNYLTARKPSGRTTYWSFDEPTVREFRRRSKSLEKATTRWQTKPNGLLLRRELAPTDSDQFFDAGGRRILIMGKERGGISEAWCHPARILSNLNTGFKVGTQNTQWSHALNPQVIVEPESLTRVYHIGEAMIEETTFAHRDLPGGGIHYRIDSKEPVEILVTAQFDLRLMWPLNDRATGSLQYAWDDSLHAIVIKSESAGAISILGSSTKPKEIVYGQFMEVKEFNGKLEGKPTAEIRVGAGFRCLISPGSSLSIAFSGSTTSDEEAERAYRAFLKNPSGVLASQAAHFHSLETSTTQIISPDDNFNAGYRWAVAATDRFFAETPGVGASFLAGYSTSDRGWDGGQKVSGRPGYAWYFGRDSVWTSFAVLEYGDFRKVRSTLEFLGRYQDVSGKVMHEFTTSGYAHYDSADSTPLYIMLMGRYLRTTGDKAFAASQFSRLLKAIEFCFSTDTDHDHLIENTNVGHGWVEGGKLFPIHTEHYLASCWASALEEAAAIATALEKKNLATTWTTESRKVREVILRDFWNPRTNFYNFGKLQDGTFNPEKTILPAVGFLLGIADRENAEQCLSEYSSANFTSDWGVRIIGRDNPMFEPSGYHYGSIWPLFTGWVSLAEFKWGRPTQGYLHALSTMMVYKDFAAGYIEEVLHGARYQPAGVCPHQAWSETMVLQPLLEGMLGISTRTDELTLRPYFPPDWKFAVVKNLTLGGHTVDMTMTREKGRTRFKFQTKGKKPLKLKFQPRFSLGTTISEIRGAGPTAPKKPVFIASYNDAPVLLLTFLRSVEIAVIHANGIGLVPPSTHPRPKQESQGLRVVDEKWDHQSYSLTVEGRAGSNYSIEMIDPGRMVKAVENARIDERTEEKLTLSIPFEGTGDYVRKIVTVRCQ